MLTYEIRRGDCATALRVRDSHGLESREVVAVATKTRRRIALPFPYLYGVLVPQRDCATGAYTLSETPSHGHIPSKQKAS